MRVRKKLILITSFVQIDLIVLVRVRGEIMGRTRNGQARPRGSGKKGAEPVRSGKSPVLLRTSLVVLAVGVALGVYGKV